LIPETRGSILRCDRLLHAEFHPGKGNGKGSPHSITERRVPELIPVLGSQPAGDVYVPISLLGEQRHDGCEQLPKTVTRQRRGCDLNPGPFAPESSTLTTRLPRRSKSPPLPRLRFVILMTDTRRCNHNFVCLAYSFPACGFVLVD